MEVRRELGEIASGAREGNAKSSKPSVARPSLRGLLLGFFRCHKASIARTGRCW